MTTCVAAFAQDSVSTELPSRNFKLTSTISGYPGSPAAAKKVSGTNESFTVTAAITPRTNDSGLPQWTGGYISSLTVELGGEEVYSDDFSDESVASKTISVKWDTTHFDHDTTKDIKVTAKMKVWRGIKMWPSQTWIYWDPVGGPPHELAAPETSVSVSIYNYGWAGDIAEYASILLKQRDYALDAYGTMNHEQDESLIFEDPDWIPDVTPDTARDGLKKATVFFFNGHGDDLGNWGKDDNGWRLGPSDVLTERQWAQSNNLPRMNFAFLNACETGTPDPLGWNSSASAFLNPIGTLINRAFMGWKENTKPVWSKPFAQKFWERVAAGSAICNARDDAFVYAKNNSPQNPAFPWLAEQASFIVGIYGDANARLHGLYTGTDGTNTEWKEVYVLAN